MSSTVPLVPLKEIMKPIERPEIPIPGKTYRQLGVKLWGEGAYERESIDGGQTSYKTLSSVQADDIVVNKIWARNGSVAVVPTIMSGCYVSGEFPTFKPIREKLDPRWFHWFTKTKGFWGQCDEKSQGTSGKNRIRPERFLEIEIPLPEAGEQRRIVARIEELAARIEEARELRRRAVEDSRQLWHTGLEMTFQKGDSVKLGDISEFVTKGATPTTYGHEWVNEGILFLRSQCVRDGFVSTEGSFKISQSADKMLARSRVQPYDILYNITGASIGRCAMFPPELVSANINQHIALIRLKNDIVDPCYITYYLNNPALLRHSLSIQAGGAQPLLSLKQVKNFLIRLPSIKEQRRIVSYLDSLQSKLDALRCHQSETAVALEALLPAVLERAFRGEL